VLAAGVVLPGRDAISIPIAASPVYVDVPPGRYWPAGAAILTVATELGAGAAAAGALGAVTADGGLAGMFVVGDTLATVALLGNGGAGAEIVVVGIA